MEAFALYLFKSVIWISGFTLVYFLFLRNERYFLLNRIFLVSGILVSIFFPLISVHYQVLLPAQAISTFSPSAFAVQSDRENNLFDFRHLLLWFYMAGIVFFAFRLIWHISSLRKTINKANINTQGKAKLIKSSQFSASFSFFNYIFVNPSVSETEIREIVIHELVHVKQKHWFDLLLVELLCLLQWVNPFAWIYTRFIRMNHEYLADEVALQHTSDPSVYKAALLNQLLGSQVISLSNSFNYSLNKKRFEMMKKIKTSSCRKMKVLLILPVFAIVLYAFAKPEYQYSAVTETNGFSNQVSEVFINEVKGHVVQENGKPLSGATIVILHTTLGVVTDSKGAFTLNNVPEDGSLVISFVGFKTSVIKPDFSSDMIIKMSRQTVVTDRVVINPAVQSPSAGVKIRSTSGKKPLVVVNGVVTDIDVDKINPDSIKSINVLKDNTATEKYGEKGKDGVIEITLKGVSDSPSGSNSEVKITGYGAQNNGNSLQGVKVIGYGVQKSGDSLQGVKVIGYGVQKNGDSLQKVMIRSTGVNNSGPSPLIIIDGVESGTDIKGINISPNDIESMQVLKNESSTKLYGEKAKNGVILIITKKKLN